MDKDVAERLLPLEGGVNFRDMGGYPTRDGRRVKWRHLYRSGTMAHLTPADREHLDERGIRTVIDFRTVAEQDEEPNAWGQSLGDAYWARRHSETFGNWSEIDPAKIKERRDAEMVMEAGFRLVPFQQADAYAEMFRRLAAGEVPAVIHCTAGKDRTGGGAALLLEALGVHRDFIISDFTMTERAVDLAKALRRGRPNARLARFAQIDRDAVKAFSMARPSFIQALLDTIDDQCGTIENYLSDLGLTSTDLESLRAHLLE